MTAKKYDHSFVIDRSEWLPAEVQERLDAASALRDEQSRRYCCLGLCLRSYGVPDASLADFLMPQSVDHPSVPEWMNDDASKVLAKLNDRRSIPRTNRESRIRNEFAKHRVRVTFKGKLFPKGKP